MQNTRRRNQSPFTDPQSRSVGPSDAFSRLNLSLEDALSQLDLYSTESRRQPPLFRAGLDVDFAGVVDPDIYYSILSEANDNSERLASGLRLPNVVNGEMGFGGAHRNPTVGVENWEAFGTSSYQTATSEPWHTVNGVNSFSGFYRENDVSFLQRKKQLGKQLLNSQFPIVPCSNRSRFFTGSDQHFDGFTDGFASDNSSVLRPNWYTQRSHQLPQFSDLRRQIISLAKDQYGCRLLQKMFEDPKEEEIETILSELIDHIGELMLDQFGNYLIQKLVKACNERQRTRIILSVTKSQFQLINICLNPHGTRAAQRLLEHTTSQQQISLVMSALSPGAVALATDPNGYHLIEHCLTHFSNEDNKYLLDEMAENCFEIATNKSGCCVLQSCVEHSQGEYRERLVAEIIANALHLAEDQYGNYVVQQLLGLRIPEITANLLWQLQGSYASLARNKYASNVVEKCLIESGEEQSSEIILELLRSPNVCMLLVDPFGNFVIQSALSVSKGVIRNTLVNLVRVNALSLRTNLYGKKVLSWFNKMKLQLV